MAFRAGPFLSYASMRSRYIWPSPRHVSVFALSAAWMSAIVASSDLTRSKARASSGQPSSRATSQAIRVDLRVLMPAPPIRSSNHPFLRQRLDLLPRQAEQLAVPVLVVLAVTRRAAVDPP